MASEGLFRLGWVSDLLAFVFDAIVAVLLYVILKPVSKTLSLMATSFRLIAHPAIASLNMLNHNAALSVSGSCRYLYEDCNDNSRHRRDLVYSLTFGEGCEKAWELKDIASYFSGSASFTTSEKEP